MPYGDHLIPPWGDVWGGDGLPQVPLSIKVKWSKSTHMILLKKAILGYKHYF